MLTFEEIFQWLEERRNQPDQLDQLECEADNISEIANIIKALAEYSRALSVGGKFKCGSSGRYVLDPQNFVAFSVHHRRSNHVRMYLTRGIDKYPKIEGLELSEKGRYVECVINSPCQLMAASVYIAKAHELYSIKHKSRSGCVIH